MARLMEDPAPAPLRRSSRPGRRSTANHRRWVRLLALGILVAGTAASAFVGFHWSDTLERDAAESLRSTAESVRNSVDAELGRDLALVRSLQGLLAAEPQLTNERLRAWYDASSIRQRYPGGAGLGWIERVEAGDLADFAARFEADPVQGTSLDGPFTVFPDLPAAEHCLMRLGIWRLTEFGGFDVPPGFDFCAEELPGVGPSTLPPVLEASAASGRFAVGSPEMNLADIFSVYAPTYDGPVPATEVGRLAASTGWVATSFDASLLASTALRGTSGTAVEVWFRDTEGRSELIAAGGATPGDGAVRLELPLDTSGWSVRVVGVPSVPGMPPLQQGLLFFAGGLLATLLLSGLLLHLGNSRARALDLVDRKTAELEHLALHDPLTDLPNRLLLMEHAEHLIVEAERTGLPVMVMFVDVDHFKSVNDTQGHAAGDELLTAIAARLRAAVRDHDIVGRIGGDEFVVLATGAAPGENPALLADRVRSAVVDPFVVDGRQLQVTISIGVAGGTGTSGGVESLLRDADTALYEAKARGRNRTVVFETGMAPA